MHRKLFKIVSVLFTVLVLVGVMVGPSASAAATTKALSTNFTLVNLGPDSAMVSFDYWKHDGTPWTGTSYPSLTIAGDGGQAIVRQYTDTLSPGSGSVVVSSSQPLGAMVQQIARSGTPSSGAYSGIAVGSGTVYVPLVAKNANSASGVANSQLFIQNTTSAPTNASVAFYQPGNPSAVYTKPLSNIGAGVSYLYDLTTDASLPNGWFSVKVTATTSGGKIGAVSNLFFGPHGLMTYNGTPIEQVDTKWFIPLLYSRLTNSLNTSLAIQNLDNVDIPANDLTLSCTKDATSSGVATLTLKNHTAVSVNGSYYFNTLTDKVRFPDNWYGSCNLNSASGKKTVVMIQYRWMNSQEMAAYEGIPGSSTDTTAFVPLVAKRLSNGFATTATIQNLSGSPATVTLTYTPQGGGTPIVRTGITIPGNGSLIRNYRLPNTESPQMADGWVGSLKVDSNMPIGIYVANTYLTVNGDQFMAYLAFTTP